MEGSVTNSATSSVTDLAACKRMFTEARDLTQEDRNRALVDLRYYHSKQLTAEEIAALRRRKQPDIVINRVKVAVNGVLGVLKQGRTDPKAWPRTPNDENAADVATKVLRYIADYNEFDDLRIAAAADYLIQGTCAVIVELDEHGRVSCNQVRWEEFFYDPHSRRADFRDARYLGIAKWMYADDVAAMYPEKKAEVEQAIESAAPIPLNDTFEDRPKNASSVTWVDRRQRRLMVVEIYYRQQGQWMRSVFHAGGVLEHGPSPYHDAKGKPDCPIVARSCYVDDENNRYGIVNDMRGPQDEINKRRSKALHLINMRQVRVSRRSQMEPDQIRGELAKPDGIVQAEKDEFDVLPTGDMAAGHLNLLMEAKGEIERMGPNPAVLGRQAEDASGRAQLVRQQAGMIEMAVVFGGIEAWERNVYRAMWNRARQFWRAPDFIRITDDEGAPQFIGINQPIMGPPQVVMGPDGVAQVQPTVLGYENALAEMDIDISLDSEPDTANLQQEQFQILAELARLYGPAEVPFDDMLMLSALTDKQKLLERRKARQEQMQQATAAQQEIQMRGAVAQVAKAEADAAYTQARAQTEMLKPELETAKLIQQASISTPVIPPAGAPTAAGF